MEIIGARPDRRILFYFLSAIILGAILLSLPVSTGGTRISFVDALFTATSAVCVTGLTVLDTGHDFTLFGQIVILVLIQLGGIGVMTFASILLLMVVPNLPFLDRFLISQTIGSTNKIKTNELLKAVIAISFLMELIGAILLFIRFAFQFPLGTAAYHAVFHAVSAFCNAGFSTFSDSLQSYMFEPYIVFVFSLLIISGGLGFFVIGEIYSKARSKKYRLSLHSKLSLSVTLALLIIGTTLIFIVEKDNAFKNVGIIKSISESFFQAVTSRTAGFNTVPMTGLTEVSLLLIMILMFIGASSGSTGGGVKTSTFGIIMLLAWNRFMGRRTVNLFRRSISEDSLRRAMTVILAAIAIIVIFLAMLMFAEERPLPHNMTHGWFVDSAFEVVSAFGTVGLSLGMTPHLHDLGKILIILLMFIGRVGLLTLIFSLARSSKTSEIVYAEESLMVG